MTWKDSCINRLELSVYLDLEPETGNFTCCDLVNCQASSMRLSMFETSSQYNVKRFVLAISDPFIEAIFSVELYCILLQKKRKELLELQK